MSILQLFTCTLTNWTHMGDWSETKLSTLVNTKWVQYTGGQSVMQGGSKSLILSYSHTIRQRIKTPWDWQRKEVWTEEKTSWHRRRTYFIHMREGETKTSKIKQEMHKKELQKTIWTLTGEVPHVHPLCEEETKLSDKVSSLCIYNENCEWNVPWPNSTFLLWFKCMIFNVTAILRVCSFVCLWEAAPLTSRNVKSSHLH